MVVDLIEEATAKLRRGVSRDEVGLAVVRTKWLLAALCEASQQHGVAVPVALYPIIDAFPRWFVVLAGTGQPVPAPAQDHQRQPALAEGEAPGWGA